MLHIIGREEVIMANQGQQGQVGSSDFISTWLYTVGANANAQAEDNYKKGMETKSATVNVLRGGYALDSIIRQGKLGDLVDEIGKESELGDPKGKGIVFQVGDPAPIKKEEIGDSFTPSNRTMNIYPEEKPRMDEYDIGMALWGIEPMKPYQEKQIIDPTEKMYKQAFSPIIGALKHPAYKLMEVDDAYGGKRKIIQDDIYNTSGFKAYRSNKTETTPNVKLPPKLTPELGYNIIPGTFEKTKSRAESNSTGLGYTSAPFNPNSILPTVNPWGKIPQEKKPMELFIPNSDSTKAAVDRLAESEKNRLATLSTKLSQEAQYNPVKKDTVVTATSKPTTVPVDVKKPINKIIRSNPNKKAPIGAALSLTDKYNKNIEYLRGQRYLNPYGNSSAVNMVDYYASSRNDSEKSAFAQWMVNTLEGDSLQNMSKAKQDSLYSLWFKKATVDETSERLFGRDAMERFRNRRKKKK